MEGSKVVKTEQQSGGANMMERLPQEVIIRILSRLPITFLMQSKLVCRAWRNLIIQDPLLATEHFSYMADNDPSFILQSHSRANNQLFFTDFSHDRQGGLISKKPPTLMTSLVDSCNGLLCMRDATARTIYICNPFTRLSLELPKLVNSPARLGHLEFGFHPTTKEYKLVHAKPLGKTDAPINVNQSTSVQYSEVHVLTLGSPGWRNLGLVPHCFIWQASKALVNRKLHWLSRPKYSWATLLISFDLETEQFQEVPKPDFCGLEERFHYLVVLKGCLSVATYQNKGLEVWLMKKYGVKESWIKEFSIGTYLPRSLRQPEFHGPRAYPRLTFPNSCVRVICSLKSGEIILVYAGSRSLVLYDPQHGTFKELTFPEMPSWFKIIVHVGSLNWLHTPINI